MSMPLIAYFDSLEWAKCPASFTYIWTDLSLAEMPTKIVVYVDIFKQF